MDRLSAVLQKYDFSLTDKAVAERVKMFLADAPKNMQKSVFSSIVGMVDVTSLHSQDTDESISALVGKINNLGVVMERYVKFFKFFHQTIHNGVHSAFDIVISGVFKFNM